jgi:hypothetical protein
MTFTNIAKMLTQFRNCYPQGSLVSELETIDRGKYIVKVSVIVNDIVLATGLAASDTIEAAEDRARERALTGLALEVTAEKLSAQQTVTKQRSNTSIYSDDTSDIRDDCYQNQSETGSLQKDLGKKYLELENSEENYTPLVANFGGTTVKTNQSKVLPLETAESASTSSYSLSNEKDRDQSSEQPKEINSDTPTKQENTEFFTHLLEQTDHLSAKPTFSPQESQNISQEELLPSSSVKTTSTETIEIDFNEIKNKTDVEIKRLGWTTDRGRDFLLQTYGKRSRVYLSDEELLDFLHYLQSQPDPV